MTIAQLINARDAIAALYQAPVDGKTALKIRRAVRLMQQPLSDYDEALKSWAEEEKIDGKQIADLTDTQRRYWSEMISAEVDQTWEAPVTADSLEGVSLSAAQLDALIVAGLVRDDEPIEDGPPMNTQEVPA